MRCFEVTNINALLQQYGGSSSNQSTQNLILRPDTFAHHDFDACDDMNGVTLSLYMTLMWRRSSKCRAKREVKRRNKPKAVLSVTTTVFASMGPLNTACKSPHTYNTAVARKLHSQQCLAARQAACQCWRTRSVMFHTGKQESL